MGATEVGSVAHTGNTSLTLKRSEPLAMPTSPVNLYLNIKTSSGSYTATFGGARLVFIPS